MFLVIADLEDLVDGLTSAYLTEIAAADVKKTWASFQPVAKMVVSTKSSRHIESAIFIKNITLPTLSVKVLP